MLRPLRVAVGIAGLLFALLAVTAAAASADPLTWAAGAPIVAPADADPADPGVQLNAVSCTGPGACTAVGSYEDRTGVRQGLLVSEFAGSWQQGLPAKLPNSPNADPEASITSVTCQSDGNCTAIGSYIDSHGGTEGVIETETDGAWGKPVEVANPGVASVSGLPDVSLQSVACASTGECVAVGTYLNSRLHPEGLLETENKGSWAPASNEAIGSALPPDAAAEIPSDADTPALQVQLSSVSCASDGTCAVAGSYVDSAGLQQGLLIDTSPPTSGNAWAFSGVEASLPGDAAAIPVAGLDSVSCTAPGACVAVGSYVNGGDRQEGVLLSEQDGSWGAGISAQVPADAGATPASELSAVSCAADGECAAVGDYGDSAGNLRGLLETETDGSWGAPAAPALPADGDSASPFVQLTGVSCSASGCAATGNYSDDAFAIHPLLLSESAGAGWSSSGVEPALPGLPSGAGATGENVSCGGGGCGAVADYLDAAQRAVAAGINGTAAAPATPTLSLGAVPARVAPGASVTPSATLSGGAGETGTVTFRVFGPKSSPPAACETGGTTVGAATVAGDGAYTSDGAVSLTAPGDYWWYAGYGGDLANAPAASACGPAMAETVIPAPPAPPGTTPTAPTAPAPSPPAPKPSRPTPSPPKPAPVPTGSHARLVATIVSTRSAGDRVTVTIACHGPAGRSCAVKLTLSGPATHAARSTRAQAAAQAPVIARASATIRTGHRRAVRLTLDRSGRRLLQTRRHLTAHLKLTEHGGGRARTTTVRLAAAARHRSHPAKPPRRR